MLLGCNIYAFTLQKLCFCKLLAFNRLQKHFLVMLPIQENRTIIFCIAVCWMLVNVLYLKEAHHLFARMNILICKEENPDYRGKLRQISVSGNGASQEIGSLETGCTNSTWRESRLILPSGLLRGAPYLRSPLIGQPILAS